MDAGRIRSRLLHGGRRGIDGFAAGVDACGSFVLRHPHFSFALAATLLFYWPALRNGSVDAGFLYGGDVVGFYWPSLVKTHALLSSFNFNALDFSQFNGSADFFLTANFFAVHPLFVVYSLFTSAESTSVRDIGRVLVVMLALHSFIACYFALRLLTRFFALDFGIAAFAATAFAFSVQMLTAHNEPQFVFCASVTPWAAYAALSFVATPGPARFLAACVPVIFGYLAGYMPLGVACLGFSVALVAARLLLLDQELPRPLRERARDFGLALVPYFAATVVVAPYLWAVLTFHRGTPSAHVASIFFSAHQLAEHPQTLLRLLSFRYAVPGPSYEFSVIWGFVAITIAALFLLGGRTYSALTAREWVLFKFAAALYSLAVLAIFGEFSVVSDLVYYFVPQVGAMHIYQRFLLPAQLLFALMIGLMLKSLAEVRPPIASRVALAVLGAALLAAAYAVARHAAAAQAVGVNNYIVMELAFAFLFVLALLVPGRRFVQGAAIVLATLPALDLMYDYSHGGHTLEAQKKRHVVALDDDVRAGVVSFMKAGNTKALVKYVDLTPMWTAGLETFPKSFPYFVLRDLNVASYGGFNFYLSTRAEYIRRMPIGGNVEMSPDWDYLARTGADFIVAREADLKSGSLAARLGGGPPPAIHRLPGGVVVVPFSSVAGAGQAPRQAAFDNGYFRVTAGRPAAPPPKAENIALNKRARQSSTSEGEARLAVDGNTNGVSSLGSVSSTGRDQNAWFELDLGAVEPIDSIRIWNRTDGAGFRLRDFWIFVSETPFGDKDTAEVLRRRPGTWSRINGMPNPASTIRTPGVRGRYVRIQFGGGQPLDESWLSLAEVEVFRGDGAAEQPVAATVGGQAVRAGGFETNHANYIKLTVESPGPATAEYLLAGNPRLRFYVNGERVPAVEHEGVLAISLPAGKSTIEVRYLHGMLTLFWLFLALFTLAVLWAAFVLLRGWQRARRARGGPAGA